MSERDATGRFEIEENPGRIWCLQDSGTQRTYLARVSGEALRDLLLRVFPVKAEPHGWMALSIGRPEIAQLCRGEKVFFGDVVLVPTPPLPSDAGVRRHVLTGEAPPPGALMPHMRRCAGCDNYFDPERFPGGECQGKPWLAAPEPPPQEPRPDEPELDDDEVRDLRRIIGLHDADNGHLLLRAARAYLRMREQQRALDEVARRYGRELPDRQQQQPAPAPTIAQVVEAWDTRQAAEKLARLGKP